MARVCVVVPVRDDPHLVAALASLAAQRRRPDRVLVVGTPSTPATLLDRARAAAPGLTVDVLRVDGGVVVARQAAVAELREETTVFLDSDEAAPPEWLERLVVPVESGRAAFSGGPTRPSRPPSGSIERYSVLLEASIYDQLVPHRVSYLPLQNTAWSTATLRTIGFDPRIAYAEDHDLETRAIRAGGSGEFVPDAWVVHDKSSETSVLRWARKRYRYLVAMAMSLLKNGELGGRLGERRRPVRHPLRYVEAAMKPVALVDATVRWRRAKRRPIAPVPPTR